MFERILPNKLSKYTLFSNEQSELEGNYSLFPIVHGGEISYAIRSYNTNEEVLSKEEIKKLLILFVPVKRINVLLQG